MASVDTLMTARYLADLTLYQNVQPYVLKRSPPIGVPRSNVVSDSHPELVVRSVRGHEEDFSLSQQGFQFARLELSKSSLDQNGIELQLEMARNYLQKLLNVDDVRVYEHKVCTMWKLSTCAEIV